MTEALTQVTRSLAALDAYAKFNRLGGYDPYPFQLNVLSCRDDAGQECFQVSCMASNQVGKTDYTGCPAVAIHATGMYPTWWTGPRLSATLKKHPTIWVGGKNNDRVRDIVQAALCGNPADPSALGTGWLPKDRIVATLRKPGVPNAMESVTVKHVDGFNVTIVFKAYEAGAGDWMGTPVAFILLDEEPPRVIYTQCLARTTATGGLVMMTFTPESGMTELVAQFMNDRKPGQMLVIAGLKDARHPDGRTHLDEKRITQLLAAYPPHEREMRRTGVPIFGSGQVFPVPDDWIVCDPFPLPAHLFHIGGLDFGSGGNNHPTAAARMAFDRDSGTAWWYWAYKSWATEVAVHCAAINGMNPWVPFAWPHDGNRADGYGGPTIANLYKRSHSKPGGIVLLNEHFQNPDGGNSVEEGVADMLAHMQVQKFKVFSTLANVFAEKAQYHRREKDGKIEDSNDDLWSAGRLAFMSRKKAIREPDPMRETRGPGFITPGVNDYNPLQERSA